MVVMESKIVFLNFSRNLVLQGPWYRLLGSFFDDVEYFIFSRGTKLVNFAHFYGMIYVYLGPEIVLLFCILFRKKSSNLFGRSGGDSMGGIGLSSFNFINDLSIFRGS